MPLLQTLQRLADVLVRIVRVLIATVSRSVVGIRWLTRTALRVRVQGSNGVTGVARLFDLHAVVVAADLSLLAGLLWLVDAPAPAQVWAAALLGLGLAIPAALLIGHRPAAGRAVIGLTLVGRGVATILAAQWLGSAGLLVLALVALILPQWAVHLTLLRRLLAPGVRPWATLWHASQYALIAGLVTGVTGVVIGAFVNGWPMWVAAVLLTVGALLALRLPAPGGAAGAVGGGGLGSGSAGSGGTTAPGSGRAGSGRVGSGGAGSGGSGPGASGRSGDGTATPPPAQRQPRQDQPTLPEGFHVYRPSSLESGDEGRQK
ncbi:hypothetical protein [Catellatospora bangladeshensis]|uniref:Uncharacterized protein n=1 Tax=Catellatospora bangladeshensis TaxID=310355 RepID=A0A8J3JL36_9ACTN|nr:hypothetical protein [Catellatospora bangladeshensis]GIF82492.1 hypothetical protein Cba03nite_38410 [Catellatospora bangladeshensis]